MKICVLGDGILARDFARLDYYVISKHFLDFKIEYILDYDVIINTYDCNPQLCPWDLNNIKKCNVDLPFLLSEYCKVKNKKYVHFSTADLYHNQVSDNHETDIVCACDSYLASKLLGEGGCYPNDLIIRTKNMFNHTCANDNALYAAIINSKPTNNLESYSWTVDIIRSTIALLKNKQSGIFNLASVGLTSQAEICKAVGITNIAPVCNADKVRYLKIGINKLTKHIIPMDVMDNIPKCFELLKKELGE